MGVVMALRSEANVFSASTRSAPARSASARSLAFSLSAAFIAARSADGVGAAAALLCEQALLNAANESKEIESMVLLRMSPVSVKDSTSGRSGRGIGYGRLNRFFTAGWRLLGLMSWRGQLTRLISS